MKAISLGEKELPRLFLLMFASIVLLPSCKTTKSTVSYYHTPGIYLTGYDNSTLARNTLPLLMPYNKIIDPVGQIIKYGDPDLENHALDCMFDPQKKYLAVIDRYGLAILNPGSFKIIDRVFYPDHKTLNHYENTFSGVTWYERNDSLYVLTSVVDSRNSYVLMFYWNGSHSKLVRKFRLEAESPAPIALPNDLAVSYETDGDYFLGVCNGNNTVVKIDLQTGEKIWTQPTGMVPYGLAIAGNKIYVTNWGGERPQKDATSTAGAPWGSILVDRTTGAASSGTVSVLSLKDGRQIKEIPVGLHPNAIISNKAGSRVYVANGNSDNVSVINTSADEVLDTIPVGLFKKGQPYYGDTPNALGLSKDEKTLYVANGMDNAIAVVSLAPGMKGSDILEGFIPTEAYPSGLALDNSNHIFVTNLEAEGARATVEDTTEKAFQTFHTTNTVPTSGFFNAHRMLASVSQMPIPNADQLKTYSSRVRKLNLAFRVQLTHRLPRANVPPRPVPERIGEPSVFHHVIYIIKENRTYDQVLGDDKKGDGDPELCAFGEKVTPNEHKLADDFLLLDNYYASGKSSAEGHQWTDAAMTTDYVEKSVRGWFRSYPHVQNDAMVYSPSGFLWNDALDHRQSVRIYGEAATPHLPNGEHWKDVYKLYQNDKDLSFVNSTTISRVASVLSGSYPGYDSHRVPDVYRARAFIKELHAYEREPGDQLPNLMVIALPADHTAGLRPGYPTPQSMVADNDLALGQIIEAVTHSRFWPTTAIFVTEDDSQDGWDHVSAYRTVGFVVSPYSRMGRTVHTNYNQTSMVRTIEQILGIPPMNMMDASALPMFDCFSGTRDLSPYDAVTNQIPLDDMNKEYSELSGKARRYAKKSMEPQFDHIDGGDDDLMNHILWFATMKGKPYPELNVEEGE